MAGLPFSCIKLSPSCSLWTRWESWRSEFPEVPCPRTKMWVVCLSYWDPGENVGTETPDDDPRSDAVSCNHPGEALTCWKVITLTELCLCKWPCLLVANCPLVPPGRFHSLSPITDLSEIAGTLLVKARTDMYLTVWSCFVGVCVCLKKSSSLTHLLPSPFTELSSSRFIFVESKFRVLGEKKNNQGHI